MMHSASRSAVLWPVAGSRPGAGASLVAAGLAATLSHRGERSIVRSAAATDSTAAERLPAAHVFVDVGSGAEARVVGPFARESRSILVLAAEATAVETAYHFLRAAFFRWLAEVPEPRTLREAVSLVMQDRTRFGVKSPPDLIRAVSQLEMRAGRLLERRAALFEPRLVVNKGGSAAGELGAEVEAVARQHLGLRLEFLGALPFVPSVAHTETPSDVALRLAVPSPFDPLVDRMVGDGVIELLSA